MNRSLHLAVIHIMYVGLSVRIIVFNEPFNYNSVAIGRSIKNHCHWGEPERAHTSESPPQILVLSTMHKKLRQKSDNLRMRREFNGVDYSAFLYGLCNRPCHDK